MRLDVREILEEHGRTAVWERTIADLSTVLTDLPPGFESPLYVRAVAQNTGSSILVHLTVSTEVELACSRCLTLRRLPVAADYLEEFIAINDQPGPVRDEGEMRVTQYEGKEIDLTEGVRENLLLALPLRPLCRPDCRGLCPQCGYNLNEGSCQCEPEVAIDPRLANLAQLLEHKEDS